MIMKKVLGQSYKGLAFLLCAGFIVASAKASPVYCNDTTQFNLTDVTWGGLAASDCYLDDGGNSNNGGNPLNPYINDWGTFTLVAKRDDSGYLTDSIGGVDFSLAGDIGDTSGSWSLSWLTDDQNNLPLTLDFFVAFKASNNHVAYLFEGITFTKDPMSGVGTFDIKITNPRGKPHDLSNIHFFAKLGSPTVNVPEPGTALLVATGIFGLVVSRKRTKKAA